MADFPRKTSQAISYDIPLKATMLFGPAVGEKARKHGALLG